MTKFTSKDAPTFSARLYPSEIKILKDMAEHMGLHGVADMLHQLASAEAVTFMIAEDTGAEMTATAKRIRDLLKTMSQDDYDALEQPLGGLAAALDYAATIRAEFEQAEHDENREE